MSDVYVEEAFKLWLCQNFTADIKWFLKLSFVEKLCFEREKNFEVLNDGKM